jgi:pyridoxal phosphate enzyme (YggS family)
MGMVVADVAQHVEMVRSRIDAVERVWAHDVLIVAVTKGFDGSAIEAAVASGCAVVGENYAQDLLSKREVIERLRPEVQFIGQLQSNKVRQIADLVTLWASVDRLTIAQEIAKRAPGSRVFIQVNATGEHNKGGCIPDDVGNLVSAARGLGLDVDGLMAVGPTGGTMEAAGDTFRTVRTLVDELGVRTCSMGMTADLEVAIAAGATQIRVGSALFGQRPRK